jgi:hypothetical protein
MLELYVFFLDPFVIFILLFLFVIQSGFLLSTLENNYMDTQVQS